MEAQCQIIRQLESNKIRKGTEGSNGDLMSSTTLAYAWRH